jgi:N-acetylglutamate synthase-like GNAT family acetyltransferase
MNAQVPPLLIRDARDTDVKAVLALLESEHHLEVAFDPREFVVAQQGPAVVACARLKRLGPDVDEIASVVVASAARRQGVGAKIVQAALARATGAVYALALAPEFFRSQGFRPLERVPDILIGKATSVCASSDFVPMQLRR